MTVAEERRAGPAAQRHAWTVHDVLRMAEVGVLGPEDRVELVEGEVVDKVVVGGPHAHAVIELTGLLTDSCRGRYQISEVWLLDLVDGLLERHTAPEAHGYALVERLTTGVVTSTVDPSVRLDVAELLRRAA